MAEKRQEKRHRKRLQVKYGPADLTKIGFTEDLSELGIFVKTSAVYPPQATIRLELTTPANEVILLEGKVMWARKVPATLVHKTKGGMGILISRFTEGEEVFRRICQEMEEKTPIAVGK